MTHRQDTAHSQTFKALAHPRRLKIFWTLVERPAAGRSLTSLMTATGLPQMSLAHHLLVMEKGGLIRRRRRGAQVAIELQPATLGQTFAAVGAAPRAAAVPRQVA